MKILFLGDNLGGGPAVLGEQVLKDLSFLKKIKKIYAVTNSRVNSSKLDKVEYIKFPKRTFFKLPKIIERLLLLKKLDKNIVVFNMTNFPIGTLFVKPEKEIVLIHNAYFFSSPKNDNKTTLFFYLREILARRIVLWIMSFLSDKNLTSFSVQSDFMFKLASKLQSRGFKVHKSRFHRPPSLPTNQYLKIQKNKWFYPASGEPHKNHMLLLDLFSSALKLNNEIKLYLTLRKNDKSTRLIMEKALNLGLTDSIVNLGWMDSNLKDIELANSEGIIFFSNFESLGLPMLEIIALKKRALILKSELSDELFEKGLTYDLLTTNEIQKAIEQKRFINALANPKTVPMATSKIKLD